MDIPQLHSQLVLLALGSEQLLIQVCSFCGGIALGSSDIVLGSQRLRSQALSGDSGLALGSNGPALG